MMKPIHTCLALAAATLLLSCQNRGVEPVRPQSFNAGWNVPLPDDRMLLAERSADAPGGSGQAYFEGVSCSYRKSFDVPRQWQGKHVGISFESIYKDAIVRINGHEAARGGYGYLPVEVDASPWLRYGEENEITVDCSNADQPDSRWYTGAGIYRPVWLTVDEALHIPTDGIRVTTQSISPARINVSAEIIGQMNGEARVEIFSPAGKKVATGKLNEDIQVPDARLWSDETPNLYSCRVVLPNKKAYTTRFGIRTIEATAQGGLRVNGKPVLLRGGCLHHSQGLLGAATYDKSEDRRVRMMKEAGFNAIRSSHNPASRALLEACDKYGVYLMDEAWDMWYKHKTAHDYATDWKARHLDDLKAMVRHDYNHPSVIMYSIGNELTEPAQPEGKGYTTEIVNYLHSVDSTRLVTCGINIMILYGSTIPREQIMKNVAATAATLEGDMDSQNFNKMAAAAEILINRAVVSHAADSVVSETMDQLDVAGYNYGTVRYELDVKGHPQRVIVGSETYPQDITKNWRLVKQHPAIIGDFMWTAWDYVGEVGCGAWTYDKAEDGFSKPYPWLLADLPAFDLIGHAGPNVAQARAAWEQTATPWIGVEPVNHSGEQVYKGGWRGSNAVDSWSWRGCEGKMANVEVISTGAEVELQLNGTTVGTAKVGADDNTARFQVTYTPGTLTAIARDASGKVIGKSELTTADSKLMLGIHPEETEIKAGDICYVPVNLEDARGTVESNADVRVTVTVEGGTLLAFGSANPRTAERYQSGTFTTYRGRAMAIVKASKHGPIIVRATAPGYSASTATIAVK